MSVVIHGDRYGDRAVGKPHAYRMGPGRDPVQVAKEARKLIQGGAWRRLPANSDREKILTLVKARLPAALGLLPLAGLYALGKQPPAGGCAWCCALVQRLPDRPELERTPATLALLGEGCRRCKARWATDARIAEAVAQQREREALIASLTRGRPHLVVALAASGLPCKAGCTPPLFAAIDRDAMRMGAQAPP